MRIVGQHRADADEDGVGFGAHLVDARARRLAGDADGLAAGQAGLAVGRHRELQQHLRPAFPHPADVSGVLMRRLLGAQARSSTAMPRSRSLA